MSSYAKIAQGQSPALRSTACASPLEFKPSHRAGQRSATAERGFRNISHIESSFFYERPPKEDLLRESVQSPYVEGKKNNNYVNPTFHSSVFLNQTMELQRSKTPDACALRRVTNNNTPQKPDYGRCLTTQTPRQAISPIISEAALANNYRSVEPVESIEKQPEYHRRRSVVFQDTKPVEEAQFNDSQKLMQSSKSEAWLNVCTGCHNFNLADEVATKKRKEKEFERDLEHAVLEANHQLLRADQEKERTRKHLVIETSASNYGRFINKRQRDASTEGFRNGDYNVEIKPHNANLASESLRCLERYQNMMDKMHDASVKSAEQRKSDLTSKHHHNRNVIAKNERVKVEEKKSGTLIKWNLDNTRSFLDKINDHAADAESYRDFEKRRASDYNCKTGQSQKELRAKSPLDIPESPFKVDSAGYEKSSEGKSILDKMYQSSLEYWKKQKQNLNNNSHLNKSASVLRKSRQQRDFPDNLDREYTSPVGRHPANEYRNEHKTSFLDKINNNDEQSAGLRSHRVRDCSHHNRSQSRLEEPKGKANLETYYNSPTKKVGQTHEVESGGWTENNKGVFHKIDKNSALLEENRKQQLSETGLKIKQQMAESSSKKKEQQLRDKHFKEAALIVCAHKANLMYCNLCNRKVPMNKISKVVAEYGKLIKNREQRARK